MISSPHLQKRIPHSHFASYRLLLYVQDILILLCEQANPDVPRVLVSAIKSCLLSRPHDRFRHPLHVEDRLHAPLTATLVRAFIRRYTDPATCSTTREELAERCPSMRVVETRDGSNMRGYSRGRDRGRGSGVCFLGAS